MCSLCMKFYFVIPAFRESYGTVLSCGAVYITVLFSLFKFVWKKICSGISFNMKPPLQYFLHDHSFFQCITSWNLLGVLTLAI